MKNFTIENFVGELISERENWEQNAYRKSNDQLYALLAECLVLYEDYVHAERKRAWKDRFIKVASTYGINRVKGGLIRPIVRVVFGDSDMCRKRVSTYGKVLEIARSEGIRSGQLVDWINANGGVQEISRPAKRDALSDEDKANLVAANLPTILRLNNKKLSELLGIDRTGDIALLVVERDDDGSVLVKRQVTSEVAVKASLRSLYKDIAKDIRVRGVEEVERASRRRLTAAIKEAA